MNFATATVFLAWQVSNIKPAILEAPTGFLEHYSLSDRLKTWCECFVKMGDGMTLEYLNRHFELLQKLAVAKDIHKMLLAKSISSTVIDGMPHGSGVSDRTGKLAAELTDTEQHISRLEKQIAKSAISVEKFIKSIDNLKTRLVFRYRFIHGMSWCEVAGCFDFVTEESVRMICYRYLEKHADK